MNRSTISWVAAVLGVLLLLSNGWWLVQSIDAGITASYRDQQLYSYDSALREATNLLTAADVSLSRSELVKVAEEISESEAFEKDGCTWVGFLGFKFDDGDQLVHVARGWSFGEEDPCYP